MNFLITAGPTREFLDPIRYLSNRSSGKMGYALARAASRHGRVTLVSGPVALKPPADITFVPVMTAAGMAREVFRRYRKADVVIMAAAVCDFRPKTVATRKIKKQRFTGKLELVPTIDILAELGRRKRIAAFRQQRDADAEGDDAKPEPHPVHQRIDDNLYRRHL